MRTFPIKYIAYDTEYTDELTVCESWKFVIYENVKSTYSIFTIIENTDDNIKLIHKCKLDKKLYSYIYDMGRYILIDFTIEFDNIKDTSCINFVSVKELNNSLNLQDYFLISIEKNTYNIIDIKKINYIENPHIIRCNKILVQEHNISSDTYEDVQVLNRDMDMFFDDISLNYYDTIKSKILYYSSIYHILSQMGVEPMGKISQYVDKQINFNYNNTDLYTLCTTDNNKYHDVISYTKTLTGEPVYKRCVNDVLDELDMNDENKS